MSFNVGGRMTSPPMPTTCPFCYQRPSNMRLHQADTGAADELPDGACPELFIKRNRLDRFYVCAVCCREDCECEREPSDAQIEAYMAARQ